MIQKVRLEEVGLVIIPIRIRRMQNSFFFLIEGKHRKSFQNSDTNNSTK